MLQRSGSTRQDSQRTAWGHTSEQIHNEVCAQASACVNLESVLALSSPMVSNRRIEFNLHCTSSCFNSSIRIAMGYKSSGIPACALGQPKGRK